MKKLVPVVKRAYMRGARHLLKKGIPRHEVRKMLDYYKHKGFAGFDKFLLIENALPKAARIEFDHQQMDALRSEKSRIEAKREKTINDIVRIAELEAQMTHLEHVWSIKEANSKKSLSHMLEDRKKRLHLLEDQKKK